MRKAVVRRDYITKKEGSKIMNVIVLAGNKKANSGSVDSTNQTDINAQISNKALLKIKDKYMIEYIINTLRKSSLIEKLLWWVLKNSLLRL